MKYDVIVVGGGSAGSVFAARLAEDPKKTVLLLEAGNDYADLSNLPFDIQFGHTKGAEDVNSPHNWALRGTITEEQGEIHVAQGKVIGGGGSINGQVFLRGIPQDFDDWASWGNEEWSYTKVLPYYRKMETDLDIKDDFHGMDGPAEVRSAGDRDQAGSFTEHGGKLFEIQGAVPGPNIDVPHRRSRIGGREHPGGEVRIVGRAAHDHLVPGPPGFRQGSAQGEGQGRHIGPEGYELRIGGAHEIGGGAMGLREHRVALAAGEEAASVVGVGAREIVPDGIDHPPGHLAARRAVEENRGVAIDLPAQGGKLPSAGIRIKAADHPRLHQEYRKRLRRCADRRKHGPRSQGRSLGISSPERGRMSRKGRLDGTSEARSISAGASQVIAVW